MRGTRIAAASIIAAISGAVLATGSGALGSSHPSEAATSTVTSTTAGGPAALVGQIEANLANPNFASVVVGAPPSRVPATSFQGAWMTITPGDQPVETRWKADLLAGAYRALAPVQGLQSIGGVTIVGRSDAVIEDPRPNPTSADPSTITTEITDNLRAVGLDPVSIEFVHPDAYAPIVVAKTSDPAAFLASHPNFVFQIFSDLNNWEGVYFEIDDAVGNPVWQGGSSSRTGFGTGWADPAFANVDGLGYMSPPPAS